MALPFDAFELKELAVEWALRQSAGDFTLFDLPKPSLEEMSMMYTANIDSNVMDCTLCPGSSLALCLDRDELEQQRINFLKGILCQAFQQSAVKEDVQELLETEIKTLNLTKVVGANVNFNKKAHALAKARVLMKLPRNGTLLPLAERKYDFEVILNTLRGGHGGQHDRVYLFFLFKNSYGYFLSTLQDATQIVTIPPLGLAGQDRGEEGIGFSRASSPQNRELSAISSSASSVAIRAMSESTLIATDNIDYLSGPARRTARPRLRGYSLEDGPWLWRLLQDGSIPKGPWHKITGIGAFDKMIDSLKSQSRKLEERQVSIIVVHFLDKAAIDQWNKIKAEEASAEGDFRSMMKEHGFDDEDIGQPFMKWMEADTRRRESLS